MKESKSKRFLCVCVGGGIGRVKLRTLRGRPRIQIQIFFSFLRRGGGVGMVDSAREVVGRDGDH